MMNPKGKNWQDFTDKQRRRITTQYAQISKPGYIAVCNDYDVQVGMVDDAGEWRGMHAARHPSYVHKLTPEVRADRGRYREILVRIKQLRLRGDRVATRFAGL